MRTRDRWLVLALLLATTAYALAEELTLTTYYPSPRGVYDQLKTMGQTILAQTGGNVGIGTATPTQKLDVDGQVRIRGGGPAAGKVLTAVDATGVTSWEPGGALRGVQMFTSSGTWVKPLGVTKVIVEVVGGGGGGNSANSVGCDSGGAGGGGGGYAKELIDVTGISSVPVTAGNAGAGAVGAPPGGLPISQAIGQPGGTSSFGSFLSATGGGSGSLTDIISGGSAGVGTGGLVNKRGQPGETLITNNPFGRTGGSSEFGEAGAGSADYTVPGGTGGLGAGGGGGAAEGCAATFTCGPGGDGGTGAVLVWEYR